MTEPTAPVRCVLAVTDLSPFANAALTHAYRIAPDGSMVRLLHVLERPTMPSPLYAHYSPHRHASPEDRRAAAERCREALARLEPPAAHARGVRTEVEVVESESVPAAILEAAERAKADVICIATHGRTGILGSLVGSVAKEVLLRASRPLLLVRPR